MPIGSASMTRQLGGRGCFARVRLDVVPSEPPHRFEVADDVRNRSHIPAVEVGATYAWEQLLCEGQNPPHVLVRLLELATLDVDTNQMMVVYVSALAFCDALSLTLRTPIEIDGATRRMSFAF